VKRFYVYELIDSLTRRVFYVGKGQGSRIEDHEREARSGVFSKKCNRIRKIWRLGGEVIRTVVRRFEYETEAYRYEAFLIHKYGQARLTNINLGGCGAISLPPAVLRERELIALAGGSDFHRAVLWMQCGSPVPRQNNKLSLMVMQAARLALPGLIREINRCAPARRRFKEAMRGSAA